MNLNKENVLKVCDALESGKYEQGTNQMRMDMDGKYCCLGVACDVSGLGEWSDDDTYLGSRDFLPSEVKSWLGFADKYGPAICGKHSSSSANDSGKSFYDISAAWRELVVKI